MMDQLSSQMVLALLSSFSISSTTAEYNPENETALRWHLLKDYDNRVRPASPTTVYLQIVLLSLNELSIEKQEMSISGMLLALWTDNRLEWNPLKHDNISSIIMKYETTWQPSFFVENSVDTMTSVGSEEEPNIRVYSDGSIKWLVPVNWRVFCEMTIFAFPFDTQECRVTLDTLYDVSELIFSYDPGSVALDYYTKNGEWDLVSSRKLLENVIADEVISQFVVILSFRRKWTFLGLSLIFPAILNSILMSAVFALPFESGEKIGYSLTVLLTYIVLLSLVTNNLPPISTEISALQIYLTSVMCIGTASTLLTVWTVAVYNKNPSKPLPLWVVYVCRRVINPLLCATCKSSRKQMTAPMQEQNKLRQNTEDRDYIFSVQGQIFHSGVRQGRASSLRDKSSRGSQLPAYVDQRHEDIFAYSESFKQDRDATVFKASESTMPEFESSGREAYFDAFEVLADHSQVHFRNVFQSEGDTDPRNATLYGQSCSSNLHYDFEMRNRGHSRRTMVMPRETENDSRSKANSPNIIDKEDSDITWIDVANLMDALFLRLVGSVIIAESLALIMFFSIEYSWG